MKKITISIGALFVSMSIFGQSNTFPATGVAGSGTTTPAHQFQIAGGTTTYTSPITYYYDWEGVGYGSVSGTSQGNTGKFSITNSTTGNTATDGTLLRQSGGSFFIDNLEKQNLTIQSNRAMLTLFGGINRLNVGELGYYAGPTAAAFNINAKYDNGLNIVNSYQGYYGISAKVVSNNDNALLFYGGGNANPSMTVKGSGITELYYRAAGGTAVNLFTIRNNDRKVFQVSNDGILRSREIIVDALNWADYVFAPEYQLMPLDSVQAYIDANGHLPNVPSTAEVAEQGLNVAKTDAILLEKIEELTIYILQQQEMLKLQDEKLKLLESQVNNLKK